MTTLRDPEKKCAPMARFRPAEPGPECALLRVRPACKKAGPAGSTAMDYRNGYHPGGSTNSSDRNSTPESDASTPNNNSVDGDDQRLHDHAI